MKQADALFGALRLKVPASFTVQGRLVTAQRHFQISLALTARTGLRWKSRQALNLAILPAIVFAVVTIVIVISGANLTMDLIQNDTH